MTLGEHILNIAEAGLAFAHSTEGELVNKLTILLNIEDILDKGRRYTAEEERSVVNKKMDELRSKIYDTINSMPRNEVQDFMAERGRQAQSRFNPVQ